MVEARPREAFTPTRGPDTRVKLRFASTCKYEGNNPLQIVI